MTIKRVERSLYPLSFRVGIRTHRQFVNDKILYIIILVKSA
jgi:hypothetical protein